MAKKPGDMAVADMTKARTIEPIPTGVNCLVAVTKWELLEARSSGAPKLHIELTVVEPEIYKSRIFFEDINLENEYTLGRLLQVLVACGLDEKDIRVKRFEIPSSDEMLGTTLAVTSKIEEAKPGSGFADRSKATKFKSGDSYEENVEEFVSGD